MQKHVLNKKLAIRHVSLKFWAVAKFNILLEHAHKKYTYIYIYIYIYMACSRLFSFPTLSDVPGKHQNLIGGPNGPSKLIGGPKRAPKLIWGPKWAPELIGGPQGPPQKI